MKNDLLIQQDVLRQLDREQTIVTGTIGVEVHHGVVKLAGRVSDHAIRQVAERAARRVADVTDIVMDIDVANVIRPPQSTRGITRLAQVV